MPLLTRLKFRGRIDQLLVRPSRETGFEKSGVDQMMLTLDGPEGDCHTGATRLSDSRTLQLYKRGRVIRNVRQLSLVSREELADVAANMELPHVTAEWFGANMLVSGIPDLTLLPPSSRLQFPSGATIVVDMENLPCRQVGDVIGKHHPEAQLKFVKAAAQKRGVTAWIEHEGRVSVGEEISIFIPPQRRYVHVT
jgi:hypothetical protein